MYRVRGLIRAAAAVCVAGSFTFSNILPSNAQGANGPVSWTGFYGGFHGSLLWANEDYPGAPAHIPPPLPGAGSGPPRHELDGGMLGLQVGAQYHFLNGFLIGVEADFSRGNLSSTERDGNYILQTVDIEWTGSLRGRLGLPMGNFMPFVTAGVMWVGANFQQSCPQPDSVAVSGSHCGTRPADPLGPFAPYKLSDSQTHRGVVYGGGIEWLVNRNFTLKAEALYFSVSDEVYSIGMTPTGRTINPTKIDYDGTIFRLGGNYRF